MSLPTLIKHRVNLISDLKALKNAALGAEIDLRTDLKNKKIILAHDPWTDGDDFLDWITIYKENNFEGPLILNTKEDALEETILGILKDFEVKNFFFLDTAVPTLNKWAIQKNVKNFAIRFSSLEPLEFVNVFNDKVDWVWVDCFGKIPMPIGEVIKAKKNFKICLVSPELQGAEAIKIKDFIELGKLSDAICTKIPEIWQSHLSL